jgi:vacuolar-type H+-ATPase subunit D/Vma8
MGSLMATENNTQRLDRIEQKLDKLTEAMISLARAEERIVTLQQDHENMYQRINLIQTKLDCIERKVEQNNRTVAIINKIAYGLVLTVAGYIAEQWFNIF